VNVAHAQGKYDPTLQTMQWQLHNFFVHYFWNFGKIMSFLFGKFDSFQFD
jgi:hypothetical protein